MVSHIHTCIFLKPIYSDSGTSKTPKFIKIMDSKIFTVTKLSLRESNTHATPHTLHNPITPSIHSTYTSSASSYSRPHQFQLSSLAQRCNLPLLSLILSSSLYLPFSSRRLPSLSLSHDDVPVTDIAAAAAAAKYTLWVTGGPSPRGREVGNLD